MKDPRYALVRQKILSGEITEFSQIFNYIPPEVVQADLDAVPDQNQNKPNSKELPFWETNIQHLTKAECYIIITLALARYEQLSRQEQG